VDQPLEGTSVLAMRRIAVIASASGNGKTTLAREIARRLGTSAIELDALVHGPNWQETPDDELRETLTPMLRRESWVCDGTYRHKIGDLVLDRADLIVWLDLPVVVWLPRLLRRTLRRVRGREPLWNDNTESLASALGGKDALIPFALRSHFKRRREWPRELAQRRVVRLRTRRDVAAFLETVRPTSSSQ
jgi:hypothetical protein